MWPLPATVKPRHDACRAAIGDQLRVKYPPSSVSGLGDQLRRREVGAHSPAGTGEQSGTENFAVRSLGRREWSFDWNLVSVEARAGTICAGIVSPSETGLALFASQRRCGLLGADDAGRPGTRTPATRVARSLTHTRWIGGPPSSTPTL